MATDRTISLLPLQADGWKSIFLNVTPVEFLTLKVHLLDMFVYFPMACFLTLNIRGGGGGVVHLVRPYEIGLDFNKIWGHEHGWVCVREKTMENGKGGKWIVP